MMPRSRPAVRLVGLLGWLVLAVGTSRAYANHSWGGYHWARMANPFTLMLGNNLSGAWDPYLAQAAAAWSTSAVLDMTIVAGGTTPGSCRPTSGRVEVCNSTYGTTGWLGVAQIWASGSHIIQGVVKMNDTYFRTPMYNTPAWRTIVLCQEVGHTVGLDHQDEDFTNGNLGTCMDYTNDPDGTRYNQLSNEQPNDHDYEELESIYAHLDRTATLSAPLVSGMPPAMADIDFTTPAQWGQRVASRHHGKVEVYALDFGRGYKVFTFVVWAQ
jgi:hypothetical protein